ncbi:MAG TPA: methyltransferase domain-containing protein [Candidatus Saccharimonadales bacterium]|nr:methyltransferase domain-containing protein [Candidatus Saccharimonadales bacterium]
MNDCCSPAGYRWAFSSRRARKEARRYERRGLDATARRIVELLQRQGVEGRTLLEVGGGVGAIQIELLKAGVTRAVSIEMTPTYEDAAGGLLRRAGLEDRVERRVMDFAEAADDVASADIVIMNRVICCYPDMPKLAGAAAGHARQTLVLSFPKATWWTRLGLTLSNLLLRMIRRRFQVFLHRPERILATAEGFGLTTTLNRAGPFWQVAALRRVEQ